MLSSRTASSREASTPGAPTTRFSISLGQIPALHPQWGGGIAISPDGSRLAYRGRSEGGELGVFYKEASELEAQRILGLGDAWNLAFSPDGERLAAAGPFGRSVLATVSLATGVVTDLGSPGISSGGVSWSSDGWIYAQGR